MVQTNLKYIKESFDESWDRIVKILGEILGTETALINSADAYSLEVLKEGGSEKEYFAKNKKYNLADVYCEDVVKLGKELEINNAASNPRWENYPALKEGLVSYLGYPIFNPAQEVVGTICVEDNKERYFTDTEKDLLIQFKEVIENQLQQFELTQQLEENIEKGKKIHQQYLPSHFPEVEELNFGTYYQSADRLGGDFYDVIMLDHKILFYVSDVSGHDLSSSMLNIFLKETINSYLFYHKKEAKYLFPPNIINDINEHFKKSNFPADYFICLLIGTINLKDFKIEFSNAGFQFPPFVTQKEGNITDLSCKGMPIADVGDKINYEVCEYNLRPGETFHINTDGLYEQTNPENEFYDENRVKELVSQSASLKPEVVLSKLYDDFFKYKKELSLQDDLTSLLIQRNS